jgi:hypothetical protein
MNSKTGKACHANSDNIITILQIFPSVEFTGQTFNSYDTQGRANFEILYIIMYNNSRSLTYTGIPPQDQCIQILDVHLLLRADRGGGIDLLGNFQTK